MADDSVEVKIAFDVPISLRNRFDNTGVPWGIRSVLIRKIFEMVVDLIEKHGLIIIGAILEGKCELRLKRPEVVDESAG